MKFKDYKHFIPIQIRFSDIDRLNHVNNACYHNYVELGRVTYFQKLLSDHVNWDKQGFILARTEMDHLEQVYLTDEIYCFTKMFSFGNKSAKIQNSIVKKLNGELLECASVTGILVAMDYEKNQSMLVPEAWKDLINKFENA
jgi:acyl-CoA thioester hydrolase